VIGRVAALGATVTCAFFAWGTPLLAADIATLRGFNSVRPTFEENGFVPYQATYVRCYAEKQWRKVRRGDRTLLGWYDGGVWIHVRSATCTDAAKLLGKGQLTTTTAVALSTLLHETIHRQGHTDEARTECLAQWLTGHVVWDRTGSAERGMLAFTYARRHAKRNLRPEYLMKDSACAQLAAGWGIRPIAEQAAPPPAPEPQPVDAAPLREP
jgi:hypothetical protein